MGYTYSGSAHTELFASYAADDPQFRTHESPNFPERETDPRDATASQTPVSGLLERARNR